MKRSLLILSLVLAPVLGWAQKATLFLETEPLGAYIQLNGQMVDRVSPILNRDLDAKDYNLRLFKPGYETQELSFKLAAGEMKVLKVTLSRSFSALAFPDAEDINLAGKTVQPNGLKFNLPAGDYQVYQNEGQLNVQPIFPNEYLLGLTGYGIPTTLLLSGLLTIQNLNSPWNDQIFLSPTTVAAYGLFVADLLWFTGLSSQKANFEKNLAIQGSPETLGLDFAKDLFAKADKALDNGDVEAATKNYFLTASQYPDSLWAPEAIFRLARLHGVQGNRALAKAEYHLLTDVIPLASLYDKSRKALADLAYADGDLKEALYHMGEITYVDPLITRDDIDAYRTQIQDELKGPKP